MKPTELRIGNWYNSVKFNQPVQLTAEDIYDLVARSDGADISHYISEMFEPIELNEEWIEKFPKGLKLPKWIRYVHQAQNWHYWNNQQKELDIKYFALTDEELKCE
jgi:hypothetical protein